MAATHTAPPREALEASPRTGEIPVLFIAGAARSGSTLIDRAIGTQEGFCSTGELQFIWQRSFGENQLCGCGSPFHECDFWRAVSARAFGVEPANLDEVAACRMKAAVECKRHVPWLLVNGPPSSRLALEQYGDLVERLYRAILDTSRARVIVDSSKDPRHGLVLSRLPGIKLRVVHLIRDPRAVAFSWRRVRKRPEIHWKSQDMTMQPVHASAKRWTTHNALVELLCAAADSSCRVRYEDFVADPGAQLSRILAPYEWVREPAQSGTAGEFVLEPAHSVAGNPMRFTNGHLSVKLDGEWREAMSLRDRLSVDALTWPLLARYGYRLRSGV